MPAVQVFVAWSQGSPTNGSVELSGRLHTSQSERWSLTLVQGDRHFSQLSLQSALLSHKRTCFWVYSSQNPSEPTPVGLSSIFQLWYPKLNVHWHMHVRIRQREKRCVAWHTHTYRGNYFISLLLFLNKWVSRNTVTLSECLCWLIQLNFSRIPKSFLLAVARPGFPPAQLFFTVYLCSLFHLIFINYYPVGLETLNWTVSSLFPALQLHIAM